MISDSTPDYPQTRESSTISNIMPTRRQFLGCAAAVSLYPRFSFAAPKPLRGIFIILATPYTENKAMDYEDLAAEVEFMDRCGVHGMVWPQMASEYTRLTRGALPWHGGLGESG